MNKQEAAEFLGCSPRQLERYTKDNLIGVRYEKGRTKPTPVYDESELQRFKEKQERVVHKPVVETMTTQSDGGMSGLSQLSLLPSPGDMAALVAAAIIEAQEARQGPKKASPQDIAAKLLLSLDEAATLTGLSRQTLRAAIAAGDLKGARVGRSFRVRPDDLKEYLEGLF